jgi:hypothetical protein
MSGEESDGFSKLTIGAASTNSISSVPVARGSQVSLFDVACSIVWLLCEKTASYHELNAKSPAKNGRFGAFSVHKVRNQCVSRWIPGGYDIRKLLHLLELHRVGIEPTTQRLRVICFHPVPLRIACRFEAVNEEQRLPGEVLHQFRPATSRLRCRLAFLTVEL